MCSESLKMFILTFMSNRFHEFDQLLITSNRNMKFISSIIYQGIMDLYYEQLEHLYTEGIEKSIRLVTPADPIFAPGAVPSILNFIYMNNRV